MIEILYSMCCWLSNGTAGLISDNAYNHNPVIAIADIVAWCGGNFGSCDLSRHDTFHWTGHTRQWPSHAVVVHIANGRVDGTEDNPGGDVHGRRPFGKAVTLIYKLVLLNIMAHLAD